LIRRGRTTCDSTPTLVRPLAFNHQLWRPSFDDDVHLAAVGITEVAQLDIPTCGILLVMGPFQKVPGHQILESLRRL